MNPENEMQLNPRQKRFADFYLGGMAAGPAYAKAGYSTKGADQGAERLLRNVEVASYIKEEQKRLGEADIAEKWKVMRFLSQAIFTPVGELDERHASVQEVTRDESGEAVVRTRIKMVSKMEAVDRLAKMQGWYAPEAVKMDLSDQLADIIGRVRGE